MIAIIAFRQRACSPLMEVSKTARQVEVLVCTPDFTRRECRENLMRNHHWRERYFAASRAANLGTR